MRTSLLRTAILGLLAPALSGLSSGPAAWSQEGAGPIIRPYTVRNVTPEEAAQALRRRAAALPEPIEISVDPATGTLLVRGSAPAQTLLADSLKAIDGPSGHAIEQVAAQEAFAPPTTPAFGNAGSAALPAGSESPSLVPYAVAAGDMPRAVQLVESLAASRQDVRYTVVRETNQIVVSAPAALHQELARRLDAMSPAPGTGTIQQARTAEFAVADPNRFHPGVEPDLTGARPAAYTAPANQGDFVPAGSAAASMTQAGHGAAQASAPRASAPSNPAGATPASTAMTGKTYRPQHVTVDQIAGIVREQFGDSLPTARDDEGGKTVIKIGGSQGGAGQGGAGQAGAGWVILDHVGGTVSIQGSAPAVEAWDRIVRGLDIPPSAQNTATIVRVERADPQQVRQAVNFLGYAGAGDVAAAVPTGAPAARFVNQPGEEAATQPGATQPPAGRQPDAAPPAAQPQPQPRPGNEIGPRAGDEIGRFGEGGAVQPGAANGFAEATEEAGAIGPVRIEFVEGLDVIIIRGNPADVARVTRLIQELDRLSETTQPRVEVKLLKNVSSGPLATLVTEVYDEILSPRQGQVAIRALVNPNAILLIGRAESVEVVKGLIDQLDQPVLPAATFRVFRLKHMSSVDAATKIGALVEEPAGLEAAVTAVPDYRTNSLIVQASPRDMQRIAQMLDTLDVVDAGAVNEVRVFRLNNSVANELAPLLQDALNGQLRNAGMGQTQGFAGGGNQQTILPTQQAATGNDPTTSQIASQMLTFLQVDPEGKKMLRSGITFSVRVTADTNSNSVVVTGPSETMDLIGALIDALDRLPDVEAQVKVFTIVNGDAESLVTTLDTLFGTSSGTTGGGGFGQTGQSGLNQFGATAAIVSGQQEGTVAPLRFAVDQRSNSIVASGSPGSLQIVERILIRLDETGEEQRRTTVYRLKNSPATEIAEAINAWIEGRQELLAEDPRLLSVIQQIERQLIVVAEPITNALIVSATDRFYDEVETLIEQLDSRPPMVNIQVLIAEVNLSEFEEFGVELGIQDAFLLNNPLGGTPAGQFFNDSGSLMGQPRSSFGVGTTSATAGYPGFVLTAGNESLSILLRTLQDQQRLQVLSKPQISTLDNQPAFVQVGQRVPRVTNITQNTGGGTTSSTELDDIGILLGVTPRTSPDGLVTMEVDIEKSSVGPASQGIPIFVGDDGTTVNSPIYNVTYAQTTVSARSGQTIVLSGLITKSNGIVSRKVPYLSDVPLLGRLFRYDLHDDDRTELLIVLTPFIQSRTEEADALRDMESERMSWCIADVVELIGETGLQSRMGWTGASPTVVYPHRDPTGQQFLDPAFESMIRDRLDNAAGCEPGMEGALEGLPPGTVIGPDGVPIGPDGLPIHGPLGAYPAGPGGPVDRGGPVVQGGPGGLVMPRGLEGEVMIPGRVGAVPGAIPPQGIPNGLHGQTMQPYEVPRVPAKPTPFDQVDPTLSRIPASYGQNYQGSGSASSYFSGPNANGSNANGANGSSQTPPPVLQTPPGDSVLLPPGQYVPPGSQAPLLIPPGTTPRDGMPTPAPPRTGVPTTQFPPDAETVTDPPPKLDSPEPADPRSIYGPMTRPPQSAPMPIPGAPMGYRGPGGPAPNGAYGPAPNGAYGPAPNGYGAAPRQLPPPYGAQPTGPSPYVGSNPDPSVRTASGSVPGTSAPRQEIR